MLEPCDCVYMKQDNEKEIDTMQSSKRAMYSLVIICFDPKASKGMEGEKASEAVVILAFRIPAFSQLDTCLHQYHQYITAP